MIRLILFVVVVTALLAFGLRALPRVRMSQVGRAVARTALVLFCLSLSVLAVAALNTLSQLTN